MGHNRNLADYAHHFDGTNIDLGSGNIETEGVVTYEDVTNVDAIGIITARAGVKVPDNQNISLGTGNDFAITHDGTNTTFINDTGQIQIRNRADDQDIILQTDDGSGGVAVYLRCDGSSGQVDLNHYGSRKFYTSSTGATVNGTLLSDSVTSELDLSAISSSITDTAVDVFVYDTSKDSDGGAWRKRTQYTSWYNETLGTATRGTRREFPAVAVIVMQEGTLTIYDGDDPDLPMWMVFTDNNDTGDLFASAKMLSCRTATSIFMLNGIFVCGGKGPYHDAVTEINFLTDSAKKYMNNGYYYSTLNISQRESTGGYVTVTSGTPSIINNLINDVAMTVLPNAPIDSATGLPVPTIAVATNSGISVIKDDGTVVNKTTSGTGSYTATVDFTKDGYITATRNDYNYVIITPIDGTDSGTNISGLSLNVNYFRNNGSNYPGPNGDYNILNYGFSNRVISLNGSDIASADTHGLNIFDVVRPSTSSMVAYITSDYNSGYQHGNIKGAFLSDTDTTNLAPNDILGGKGTFDDASYWTAGATWSISGGVATSTTSGSNYLSKNGILTTGARYTITLTVSSYSAGTLYVYCGTGAPGTANHYRDISANGTYTFILDAYNTNFGLYGANFGGVVDNVTVSSVVDQDRSVNGKDLGVLGTITKSAVATGADLVGYSGFSNSTNYLSQPPNSDLAIGNSDFSSVGWFKKTTSSNTGVIIYANDGSNQTFDVRVHTNMKMLAQITDDGFSTREIVSNQGSTVNDNIWHQYHAVRRSNIMYLYLDGELLGSSSSVEANITNSLGVTIGAENLSGNAKAFQGSLALIRFSKSAPTAAQVKKMYEDEKFLFQENAKATLYGSSDAVTALAYDEVTEQLHVGTSAGRSDFRGLRRINNTTTAVTTAISAHDGFIVEQ